MYVKIHFIVGFSYLTSSALTKVKILFTLVSLCDMSINSRAGVPTALYRKESYPRAWVSRGITNLKKAVGKRSSLRMLPDTCDHSKHLHTLREQLITELTVDLSTKYRLSESGL